MPARERVLRGRTRRFGETPRRLFFAPRPFHVLFRGESREDGQFGWRSRAATQRSLASKAASADIPTRVRVLRSPPFSRRSSLWDAFIRSGTLAASVRATRNRSKRTLACSPRVPSRAGNDRLRESGSPPRSKARSSFGTPHDLQRPSRVN